MKTISDLIHEFSKEWISFLEIFRKEIIIEPLKDKIRF